MGDHVFQLLILNQLAIGEISLEMIGHHESADGGKVEVAAQRIGKSVDDGMETDLARLGETGEGQKLGKFSFPVYQSVCFMRFGQFHFDHSWVTVKSDSVGKIVGGVEASGKQFSFDLDGQRRPARELSQFAPHLVQEVGADFENRGVRNKIGAFGLSPADLLVLDE